jgi:hypothetical protein
MAIEERFGYLTKDQFIREIGAPVGTQLTGTFQGLDETLTALAGLVWSSGVQIPTFTAADTVSFRSVGAASSTDILDRAAGDARYSSSGSGVLSFNTRVGAVTLTSGDVTTALGYIPTSVAGLTGSQTVAAFKTGLSLVKADVGLGSVDNTADAVKAVLSATKWVTARNLAGNSVDGSANVAFANKFVVQGTTDTGLSAAQFLGALGTGIVKNTTTTGVLSIAVAADFPTLNQSTTGSAATLTTGRTISITGDLTYTSSAFDGSANVTAAGTLATVNSNVGSFGSATQVATFTVNAKGLTTAAANVTITPAVGSITGLGTGVATALAVSVGSAGAFVTFNGALGTPSSLTLTNATGLPISGLTSSTTTAVGVGSIELGHASDTTISRVSAGDVAIEGNTVYRVGGTDVSVADGGTGRSTSTTAYGLIAAGTTATGAHQTLAAGATTEVLVGGGSAALPVWTAATGTGSPVRAASPTLTGTLTAAAITASGNTTLNGNTSLTSEVRHSGAVGQARFETTGTAAPAGASGPGIEIGTPGGVSTRILSYDRTANSYSGLLVIGSTVTIQPNASTVGVFSSTGLVVTGVVKTSSYTVATLPSAATVGAGATAFVTDATTAVFGGTVIGGGAVASPVYSDGIVWRSG